MPWGFAVPADWRRLNARIDQTQAQRNDGSGALRRSTSHGFSVVLTVPQTPQGHPRIEEECVGRNESRQYDATAAAVVVGRIPM